MRVYYFIIFPVFLAAYILYAQEVTNPLGRFAKNNSSYDYNKSANYGPRNLKKMQALGGLVIQGFPTKCADATINEALPGHDLGYGRIEFMGSSWAFEYMADSRPGPALIAEVAKNLGLMGQSPYDDLSIDLMSVTPEDRFVVAQLLDRSDLGLDPIVTCISPIFRGRLIPGRPLVFGRDYWSEYDRLGDYRWEYNRRDRYPEYEEYNWRNNWQERIDQQERSARTKPPAYRPNKVKRPRLNSYLFEPKKNLG